MTPAVRLAAGLAAGVVCLVMPLAEAQEAIYRCGHQYTERPCEGARQIRPAPVPSDDEREAARTVHWRQSLLADELAAEREQQAARPKGGPSAIRGRAGAAEPAPSVDSARPGRERSGRERASRAEGGRRGERDETFRAVVPRAPHGGKNP